MVFFAMYVLGVLVLYLVWRRQTSDDRSFRAAKETLAKELTYQATIIEPLAFIPIRNSQPQIGEEMPIWCSDLPTSVSARVQSDAMTASSARTFDWSSGIARARNTKLTDL